VSGATAVAVAFTVIGVKVYEFASLQSKLDRTANSSEVMQRLIAAGYKVEKLDESDRESINDKLLDALDHPLSDIGQDKQVVPTEGWQYRPSAQLKVDGKMYFVQHFEKKDAADTYCARAEFFDGEHTHNMKRFCWVVNQWAILDLSENARRLPLFPTSQSEISKDVDFSRMEGAPAVCAAMKSCCVGDRLPPAVIDRCRQYLPMGRGGDSCKIALEYLVELWGDLAPKGCAKP
jgi:hypothetical protein